MSEKELSERIERLKTQIERMSQKRTSSERISTFGAIATPILVVLIGGILAFTQTQQQTETISETATQDRWVEQAKLAKDLMADFVNEDELRSRMALELVAHADANLGSRLSKIIAEVTQDTSLAEAAAGRRVQLREQLIRQLIHDSKSVRWDAAEALLAHSDDPELIGRLIAFAKEDPDTKFDSGPRRWRIHNAMTVMLDLARSHQQIVIDNQEEILSFADWAKEHDSRTKNMALELKSLLQAVG